FHPTRPILAIASPDLQFWDTRVWKPLQLSFEPPANHTMRIAFSPDGKNIVLALNDGSISLWNLADGRKLRTIHPNTSAIVALAFSHNGSFFAAANDARTVTLYDATTLFVRAEINNHLSEIGEL